MPKIGGWDYHWKRLYGRRHSFKHEAAKMISRHKIPAIGYLKLSSFLKINYYIDFLKVLPLSSQQFIEMQNILNQLFDNQLKYKFDIMQHGLNYVLFMNSDNDQFTCIEKLDATADQLSTLYKNIIQTFDDNMKKETESKLDAKRSKLEQQLPDQIISHLLQFLDLISLESVNATNRNLSLIARQFSSWHPIESNDIFCALFSVDNLVKSMMGKQNKTNIKNMLYSDENTQTSKPLNDEQIEECQILFQFADFFHKKAEIDEINKLLKRRSYNSKDFKIKCKSIKIQHKIYKILKHAENDLKRFRPKSVEKLESIKKLRKEKIENKESDTEQSKQSEQSEDDNTNYDSDNLSIFAYSLTKRPSKPVNTLEININKTFIRRTLEMGPRDSLQTVTISDLDKMSKLSYLPFDSNCLENLDKTILQNVMQSFFGNVNKLILNAGIKRDRDDSWYFPKHNDMLEPEVMDIFINNLCTLPFWKYWKTLTQDIINIKHIVINQLDDNDWSLHLLQDLILNISPNATKMEIGPIGCARHTVYTNLAPFLCNFINNFTKLCDVTIYNETIHKKSSGIYWYDFVDIYDEAQVMQEINECDEIFQESGSTLPKIKTLRFVCERLIPKSLQSYLFGVNLISLDINLQKDFVNELLNEDLYEMKNVQWNFFNLKDLRVVMYDGSQYNNWFKLLHCPSLINIKLFIKYNQDSHSVTEQEIVEIFDESEFKTKIKIKHDECLTEIKLFEILADQSNFVILKSINFNYEQIYMDEDGYEHNYDSYTSSYGGGGSKLNHIKMLDGVCKMIKARNQKDLSLDICMNFANKKEYNIDTTTEIWKYVINFIGVITELQLESDIICRISMQSAQMLLNHLKFLNFVKSTNNEKAIAKTFQYFARRKSIELRWKS